jgi:ribosomal protein S6--L-glutamate ligase
MKVIWRPSCAADAVILPQGCRESLYRMARQNCPHVFPDYDARFQYPGKTGQARLFQALGPPTREPGSLMRRSTSSILAQRVGGRFSPVFKLDWGGEGDTVFLLQSPDDLARALSKAAAYERSGQRGFVLQTVVADVESDIAGGRDRTDPEGLLENSGQPRYFWHQSGQGRAHRH